MDDEDVDQNDLRRGDPNAKLGILIIFAAGTFALLKLPFIVTGHSIHFSTSLTGGGSLHYIPSRNSHHTWCISHLIGVVWLPFIYIL